MSCAARPTTDCHLSAGDKLVALGWELNASQYQAVHLAARFDDELEWFHQGLSTAAAGIADRLQLHISTAREWIRVGHSLRDLPLIDAAFRANDISFAKARILTRWADPDNEEQLLNLAENRSANRLTTAIAKALAANDDSDDERDRRHHAARSFSSYTDGDGMTIIRAALPPSIAKPVLAAIEELVRRIAQTPPHVQNPNHGDRSGPNKPSDPVPDTSADVSPTPTVFETLDPTTHGGEAAPADARPRLHQRRPLPDTLAELRQRWQPGDDDEWSFPTLAQQHADAFAVLFLDLEIDLSTEIVIHVRGDGNTFDDGTPITTNAISRQLDQSFIRLLIHDAERQPLNASNRRRHPTTRQKRVVLETHNHQCIDCARTDLLELDHNPPYHQTKHTITSELEPRCAPCHRARHRRPPAV